MTVIKTTESKPPAPELSIKELAQILLALDENELDTLEILLDPQARMTLEQSLEDLEKGRTIPIEEW